MTTTTSQHPNARLSSPRNARNAAQKFSRFFEKEDFLDRFFEKDDDGKVFSR